MKHEEFGRGLLEDGLSPLAWSTPIHHDTGMSIRVNDATHGRVLAILSHGPAASVIRRSLEDEGFLVDLRDARAHKAVWRDGRSFDAVLVDDDGMEPDQAVEAIERGWVRGAAPLFVLVERLPGRDRYLEWLEAGAWDVLKVPLEATALPLRLRNILAQGRAPARPRTARPYSLQALEQVADEALALAHRYERDLHCVAMAVDWPTPEEPGGNAVIQKLADAAETLVRSSDLVGIGDERTLIVLLPDTDEQGTRTFTHRLGTAMETRLREWGVLAQLRTGFVAASEAGSGRDLMSLVVRRLGSIPL